ncbi:MAG: helix-turn-helix transcriptional regulator [Planctomycetes bacterium]|nr:helix-turn-helix transcriptional regulator [Planctomycetota bacterium]
MAKKEKSVGSNKKNHALSFKFKNSIAGFSDKEEYEREKNLFERKGGQNIRKFRRGLGWSQEKMAQRLGVSQQELSKMESSGGSISTTQLFKLQVLGADVGRLFDVNESNPVAHAFDIGRKLWEGGVEAVYPTRSEALQALIKHIRHERLGIHVVGSSLKGITMDRPFIDAIEERLRVGVEFKVLIGHRAFSVLRARVEGRENKSVGLEIEETISIYCDRWKSLAQKEGQFQARVALHPPTIFFILLLSERRAIINPYPLTIEAYNCPCLMVTNNDNPDCMYHQYHKHHFLNAWNDKEHLHRKVSIDLDVYRNKNTQMGVVEEAFEKAVDDFFKEVSDSSEENSDVTPSIDSDNII